MAAVLNVNDILIMKVICSDGNQIQVGINTLHYQVTAITGGAPNGTDLVQTIALDNAIAASYKAWLANNAAYRGVIGQKIRPVATAPVSNISNAGFGTAGANSLPDQVSGLITLRTGLAGRKFRGRIYPPFPATAWAQASGGLTAGALAALNAIAAAIPLTQGVVTAGVNTQITLGIYHRGTFTIDPVQTKAGVNFWATQRKRGEEGRTNLTPI